MDYTLQYYDLVLVAIIGSIALGGAIGALTPIAMPFAIVLLGAVAIAFMGHAMFVNGPVDDFEDLTQEVDENPINPGLLD
ncbi:hypothetical protein HWV07_09215 [Natronomonas salina]|uniref:hypothetical protein n=1 Tax=Natronomonas salina TaxID=1710540 RepID=UPI0015B54006|nr:hypothetical protein [Natronomonas salina]QLD89201.1 hypothetical protein HWV07_09215 [Natronomonas salina]